MEKQTIDKIIKYEKSLGTKAVFHDNNRQRGNLKLADISMYQTELVLDISPSNTERRLNQVRLQRSDESFKPETYIYYYFSPKDSTLRKASFFWNVVYNQSDSFNDNWFDEQLVNLSHQIERFDEYNNQFNSIYSYLVSKLGPPKYFDKEKTSKKEGTIEFWQRKAIWETSKLSIQQKLDFSKSLDEIGFGIFEIVVTIEYK